MATLFGACHDRGRGSGVPSPGMGRDGGPLRATIPGMAGMAIPGNAMNSQCFDVGIMSRAFSDVKRFCDVDMKKMVT